MFEREALYKTPAEIIAAIDHMQSATDAAKLVLLQKSFCGNSWLQERRNVIALMPLPQQLAP